LSRDISSPATGPTAHSEQTQVFVLMAKSKRFVSLVDLATARQWVYAFTSLDKAKAFVRVMRKVPGFPEVDRVLPCTLGEWFTWQPKQNLPDLTIDPDPDSIANYPLRLNADAAKSDIQCVTEHLPSGTVHRVTITPRSNPSQA
jgi:hypothetical protein